MRTVWSKAAGIGLVVLVIGACGSSGPRPPIDMEATPTTQSQRVEQHMVGTWISDDPGPDNGITSWTFNPDRTCQQHFSRTLPEDCEWFVGGDRVTIGFGDQGGLSFEVGRPDAVRLTFTGSNSTFNYMRFLG